VVFRRKAVQSKEPRANFPELKQIAEMTGSWEIRFEFQDGPTGFNAYREINLVGTPTIRR
jgi:hypothetical protein